MIMNEKLLKSGCDCDLWEGPYWCLRTRVMNGPRSVGGVPARHYAGQTF